MAGGSKQRRKKKAAEARQKVGNAPKPNKTQRKAPEAKMVSKAMAVKARYAKMVDQYLLSLLDPWNYEGKVPDYETYPTSTFYIHETFELSSDAGQQFSALVMPHWKTLIRSPSTVGGQGTNFNWTSMTPKAALKATTVNQNFALLRPVSMGVKLSYMGPALEAGGLLCASLYDWQTALPTNYKACTEAPKFTEVSITGESTSLDILWRPLSFSHSDYMPTDWIPTLQGVSTFWAPVAATTNVSYTEFTASMTKDVISGANTYNIRMGPYQYPHIVLAARGLPASKVCIRVEIRLNLEATIQTSTLALTEDTGPSPVSAKAMNDAAITMSALPVAKPKDTPSWVAGVTDVLHGVKDIAHEGKAVAAEIFGLLNPFVRHAF